MFFSTESKEIRLSRVEAQLPILHRAVNWEIFRPIMKQLVEYHHLNKIGNRVYDDLVMFRLLILQKISGLSSGEIFIELKERNYFAGFVGVSAPNIPDAVLIEQYKTKVESMDMLSKMYTKMVQVIQANGFGYSEEYGLTDNPLYVPPAQTAQPVPPRHTQNIPPQPRPNIYDSKLSMSIKPARRDTGNSGNKGMPLHMTASRRGSVLVISRAIPFMEELSDYILDAGYEILHAKTISHAVLLIKKLHIKIAFLNSEMLYEEGSFGQLEQAENATSGAKPPVIYLYSSNNEIQDTIQLSRLNVQTALSLPLKYEESKPIIAYFLQKPLNV